MSSVGTKVTKDPASKQEIPEAVGIVTSDSLAAESLKGSGSFGEGNPHAAASKQPSKSTTTNNTDTSSATKLPPAVDAEAREAQEGWSEAQQLKAGEGLGKDAGVGPTYSSAAGGGSTGASSGNTSGGVPTAPTGGYAGAADQARNPAELKPKGNNLKEVSDLEGKRVEAEIGSENDPGRLAEQKLQLKDAMTAGSAAGSADTSKLTGEHPYSVLGDTEA